LHAIPSTSQSIDRSSYCVDQSGTAVVVVLACRENGRIAAAEAAAAAAPASDAEK